MSLREAVDDIVETRHDIQDEKQAERERADESGRDIDEFHGRPYLLIQSTDDDNGYRPLDRRPHQSDAMSVQQGTAPAYSLEPGNTYQLSCVVQNLGDIDVPIATVEFFVSTSTFEPIPQNEFSIALESVQDLTAHGMGVVLVGRIQRGQVNLQDELEITTADGTTVSSAVTRIVYRGVDTNSAQTGGRAGLWINDVGVALDTNISVRKLTNSSNGVVTTQQMSNFVHEIEFLSVETVSIPAKQRTTVSVFYQTPPTMTNARGSRFYARAYSLSPQEIPDNFAILDHIQSRLVGVYEMKWR